MIVRLEKQNDRAREYQSKYDRYGSFHDRCRRYCDSRYRADDQPLRCTPRAVRCAASSAHLYYEMAHDQSGWAPRPRGTVPTGVAVSLSQDVAIRRFAERDHNIVYWSELDRGGHFLALEEPELFARDVRKFFAFVREK